MSDAAASSIGGDAGGKKPSPLIRVLAQVRWPVLTGFDFDEVNRALAKAIRSTYPRYNEVKEAQLIITPEGVTQQQGGSLHRFQSADASSTVTFAPTFITLETSAYTSHEVFVPRLGDLIDALTRVQPIPFWERFGYRYTNRIADERDLAELTQLFDPAVLGLVPLERDVLRQSITEAILEDTDSSLLVRSLYVPEGTVIEPTIPPLPQRAWFLDLDAFSGASTVELTRERAEREANALSDRAHVFFKKVSTDEYRARYA